MLPWIALPGVRQDRKASLWSTVVSLLPKKVTHPARAANPGGQTMRIGLDAKPTMHIGLTANTYTHLAMAKLWAPFSIFSHAVCSWLDACVTKDVMSWSTFAVDQFHSPNLIWRWPSHRRAALGLLTRLLGGRRVSLSCRGPLTPSKVPM